MQASLALHSAVVLPAAQPEHKCTIGHLSIGLNVGPVEPIDQFARTLREVDALLNGRVVRDASGSPDGHIRVDCIATGASEWEGQRERFVQVRVSYDGFAFTEAREKVRFAARFLAGALRQDCVAVGHFAEKVEDRLGQRWTLVRPTGVEIDGGTLGEFPLITV